MGLISCILGSDINRILELIFVVETGLKYDICFVGRIEAHPFTIGLRVSSGFDDQSFGGLEDLLWGERGTTSCCIFLAIFNLFEDDGERRIGIDRLG